MIVDKNECDRDFSFVFIFKFGIPLANSYVSYYRVDVQLEWGNVVVSEGMVEIR